MFWMDMDLLKVKIPDENTWDSRFYFLITGQVYQRCNLLSRNFGKFVSQGTQSSKKKKKERAENLAQETVGKIPWGEEFFFVSYGQKKKKADEDCIQCKHNFSGSSLHTGIPVGAVLIVVTFCVLFDVIQFLLNKTHLD